MLLCAITDCAFAAFSLSAVPFEGGYDLRYGQVSLDKGRIDKEVVFSITSDIAKQYRVVQSLLEPLTNSSGKTFPPQSFVVYQLNGTNKFGALNVQQEIPVNFSRQTVYTSNPIGSSDSFTLVYSLVPSREIASGSYRGRIAFILEPMDSNEPPATVILNIFAEVEIRSVIEITTETGAKDLRLRSDRPQENVARVMVNIKGDFGSQFRILQIIEQQPISNSGQVLDYEAVNFLGRDARKGTVINQPTPFSEGSQVIYTSSPSGEGDAFIVEYSLTDTAKQTAGTYTTRIKYVLESIGAAGAELIDVLGLEIENPRAFELDITSEQGGIIRFSNIKPKQPPQTSEVVITVKTNIGKQYQVTQGVLSGLINKEGATIPAQYFTLKEESRGTKGALKFTIPAEVKTGDTVLFVSDADGSPDTFKMIYELSVPFEVNAGEYSTRITYSISEI
jgi:hypothetical protein